MASRRIRPAVRGGGDGLFLLLVAAALGGALYDLAATVRHLALTPRDCRLAVALDEYRRGGSGGGVPSDPAPTNATTDRGHGAAFPKAPGAVPLLLLPQRLDWSQRKANARHLLQDGVAQSPYLTWWGDPLPRGGAFPDGLVLVLDLLGARQVYKDWCRRTSTVISAIQRRRLDAQQQRMAAEAVGTDNLADGGLAPLPLAIIDNRDYPVISFCPGLTRLLEPPEPQRRQGHGTLIRYSFRSAALRRKWQPHLQWVRVGKLLLSETEDQELGQTQKEEMNPAETAGDNTDSHGHDGSGDQQGGDDDDAEDDEENDDGDDDDRDIEYNHRPIGVRTDIVKQVQEHLTAHTAEISVSNRHTARGQFTHLCHPIEEMDRPIDVSYFWDHQNHSRADAHLRDTVYEILDDMGSISRDAPPPEQPEGWDFRLGVQGANRDTGRKNASPNYVAALLETKIVVVAQRDEWEDHYRLFEAIVAGAMAMTDTMLGLPHGLQDGESVVVYGSAQELRDKLIYYLEHPEERIKIAKQGRDIAMSMHRSWHHMEQVIFGRPLTVCPSPSLTDGGTIRCPFVVNVDEMKLECPRPATTEVADPR